MTTTNILPENGALRISTAGRPPRRSLMRQECIEQLRQRTSGRLAITTGALPFIAVVRYYLLDDTIYLDIGSPEAARTISQQIVAFESGTTDADPGDEAWSVCTVGVAVAETDHVSEESVLKLHPELLAGWAQTTSARPPAPPRADVSTEHAHREGAMSHQMMMRTLRRIDEVLADGPDPTRRSSDDVELMSASAPAS